MTHHLPEEMPPDITCREALKRTSAYLDEHVEDAFAAGMAQHLATCAGCATYLKQIMSVRDMLAALPSSTQESTQRDTVRQAFSARWKRKQSSP
jgi:predicted anti-sigma-YlaC factor YlaD